MPKTTSHLVLLSCACSCGHVLTVLQRVRQSVACLQSHECSLDWALLIGLCVGRIQRPACPQIGALIEENKFGDFGFFSYSLNMPLAYRVPTPV